MSEETFDSTSHVRTTRLLAWGAAGMTVLVVLSALFMVFIFDPSETQLPDVFAAGPSESFEPGQVIYFAQGNFFLVRLERGDFLALYDLPPNIQRHVAASDEDMLTCRLEYVEDGSLEGALAGAEGLPPGFEDRGFQDPCLGSVYDAEGYHASGPSGGRLDHFPAWISERGIVQVDLNNRRCMNPVTEQAPCISTR